MSEISETNVLTRNHTLSHPETWVDQYGDYLYGFAILRLKDKSTAQDAVQETFLAALQAKHTFNGKSSEKTWLTAILKYKIIDTLRRLIKTEFLDDILPFEKENLFESENDERPEHWRDAAMPIGWENTPYSELERKEFWNAYTRCHEKLSPRLASLFSLREFDDESTEYICKELDITETNLWVMLYRARMHLRRCLELTWFAEKLQHQ